MKFYSDFLKYVRENYKGQYYHVSTAGIWQNSVTKITETADARTWTRMIGVIFREHQKAMVEEFFELFKTPWEPFREGGDIRCRPYDESRRSRSPRETGACLLLRTNVPWTIGMESGSIPA